MASANAAGYRSGTSSYRLTVEQLAHFESFGFLTFPGLFRAEIDEISAAFDEVFDDETRYRNTRLGEDGTPSRVSIPYFLDQHERLRALRDDARVLGIASSLLGPDFEYAESDGNQFRRETSWHTDVYGASPKDFSIKMQLYLDPLTAGTGALQVIPGSHVADDTFAKTLRHHLRGSLRDPLRPRAAFGIDAAEIPSYVLSSEPGDLLVWNFRLYHASFGSREMRRAMSVNFKRLPDPSDARAQHEHV